MSSADSAIHRSQSLPRDRVECGLVQVDVAFHGRLYSDSSDEEMKCITDTIWEAFHAIAELRGGKLHSWEGNCAAFLFPVEGPDSINDCGLAAIQMLEMLPSLNEDVRSPTDLDQPIEARISCDAGMAANDPEHSKNAEDFVAKLMKHERQVGAADRVTITERIHRQLTQPFRSRFVKWKYSSELEVALYSAPPFPDTASPQNQISSSPRAEGASEGLLQPGGATIAVEGRPATAGRPRSWVDRAWPWMKAGAVLGVVLLAGVLMVHGLVPAGPATAPSAAPTWNESVRSPEWTTWRKQVHEKLAAGEATETTLSEALLIKPPSISNPPAAVLRQDQAIADVLLSYPGVHSILRNRFGIDKDFLGTGLSNPVSAQGYCSASVHEYLIPNLRDDDPRVWMRKLGSIGLDREKKVKDLIEEDTEADGDKQILKKEITSLGEAEDKGPGIPPVIRFALLDQKKYSGKLGRPDAVRVFASDLVEVWNLKVKEAADRSGYTFKDGDTFFVWVFVPSHREQAVPATWGEVLNHLPAWLEKGEDKGP